MGKKRFSQQGGKEEEEDGEEGDQKDAADLMPLVEEEDFFPQPFPSHFYFSASGAEKFLLVFPAKPEDIFFRANRFGKRRGAGGKNLFSSFSSLRPLFNPSSFFSPQIEARDQLNYFDSALPSLLPPPLRFCTRRK